MASESRSLSQNDGSDPALAKNTNDGQSSQTEEIVHLSYLKNTNMILAINGDQNAFLYGVDADKG